MTNVENDAPFETLRRAAALMRERAEAALAGTGDPWYGHPDTVHLGVPKIDAEHIASWHPAVALAVADWLDDMAESVDLIENDMAHAWTMVHHISQQKALAVARTYLGEACDG